MIVTEQKPLEEIIDLVKAYKKIFLVGCGECATTCKTGGSVELAIMKETLNKHGVSISGECIPEAPCVASKIKAELAKNLKAARESDAILVFACGLGVQSVKENNRLPADVLAGCNTLFAASLDAEGILFEKCSLCGTCILSKTGTICPVTLCSKGILNGPCGGMHNGKCETDKERDCAWILIYKELEKKNKLNELNIIQPPRDFKKSTRPRKLVLGKE